MSADLLRTRVARALDEVLATEPEFSLVGSWACGEAHVMEMDGDGALSLSDVDVLVSADSVVEDDAARVRRALVRALGVLGRPKVSIRPVTDYRTLPHGAAWVDGYPSPVVHDVSDHLMYWTATAALEGWLLDRRVGEETAPVARSYSLVKYFYAVIRCIADANQTILRTYREVGEFAEGALAPRILESAYAVKLGASRAPVRAFADFFAADAIRCLADARDVHPSDRCVEIVCEMASDVANGSLDPEAVVERMNAADSESRWSAVTRYQWEKVLDSTR